MLVTNSVKYVQGVRITRQHRIPVSMSYAYPTVISSDSIDS